LGKLRSMLYLVRIVIEKRHDDSNSPVPHK